MSAGGVRCPECGALNPPEAEECHACQGILLDLESPEAGATADSPFPSSASPEAMPYGPYPGSMPPGTTAYGQPPYGNFRHDEFEYKEEEYDASMRFILPVGRSGLAIAAGYLGLFSLIVFPAPLALLFGILAVRDLKMNPKKLGMGRAVFGIIAGAIGSVLLLIFLVAAAF